MHEFKSCPPTTTTKTETITETGTSTNTNTETQTHTVTETVTQTPTTTSTPAPSPENPAEVGQPVKVKIHDIGGTKTIEVTVLEYIRGEKANQMVKDANMFNEEPKEGYEYLLVKIRVKYLEGSGTFKVGPYDFKVMVNGALYNYKIIVMPDETPQLEYVDVLPGGNVEGWIAFMVPSGEKAIVAYQPNTFKDPLAYFLIPAT